MVEHSHHFVLDPPNGTAFVVGRCKFCGAEKQCRVSDPVRKWSKWDSFAVEPRRRAKERKASVPRPPSEPKPLKHPGQYAYRKGCRCGPCVDLNREHNRAQKRRRREVAK